MQKPSLRIDYVLIPTKYIFYYGHVLDFSQKYVFDLDLQNVFVSLTVKALNYSINIIDKKLV